MGNNQHITHESVAGISAILADLPVIMANEPDHDPTFDGRPVWRDDRTIGTTEYHTVIVHAESGILDINIGIPTDDGTMVRTVFNGYVVH